MIRITDTVKHLIIINVLFFVATFALTKSGINLTEHFGLFFVKNELFKIFVQSSIKATSDMDLLNKHNIYLNTDNKILIIGKAIMIDLNKKTINALTGKEMADYMAKPRSDRKQLIIRNQ